MKCQRCQSASAIGRFSYKTQTPKPHRIFIAVCKPCHADIRLNGNVLTLVESL